MFIVLAPAQIGAEKRARWININHIVEIDAFPGESEVPNDFNGPAIVKLSDGTAVHTMSSANEIFDQIDWLFPQE